MLKIVLIFGIGFALLAIVIGIGVIIYEHWQHKSKETRYNKLHRQMGLGDDLPDRDEQ